LLRHASSSPQGVQFHPESIITQSGMKIVENFVKALPQ
jgi:anthranilate synthase component 2